MAQLLVIYGTPDDPDSFDRHYHDVHVPLAKAIPGLRRYTISRGPVATQAGPAAGHLIAMLEFDDLAAIQAAFASPEGQAAAEDVQGFATGGADMMMFDTREV